MANYKRLTAAILLLLVVIAAVAAVPTSVLLQNSEVTSNMNAANNNKNNNNNMLPKVKRSSNNAAKESMPTNSLANAFDMDKKSSPEVLPPAFNAPATVTVATQQSNAANAGGDVTAMLSNDNGAGVPLPGNGEIINSAIAAGLTAAAVEAAAAANQREFDLQQQQQQLYAAGNADEDTPTQLYKRGINAQQYLYGNGAAGAGLGLGAGLGMGSGSYGNADYYSNPYLLTAPAQPVMSSGSMAAAVPNGIWADEMDPSVVYTDLQDLQDDYAPAPRVSPYRNKAYDNLQSILNAEAYLEPYALPLQYTSRYYGAAATDAERNKRSNINAKYNNKYADLRLKRDTKLTPADMLALVALVEAGERARKDTDAETTGTNYMYPNVDNYNNYNGYNSNPKSYYPSAYDYPNQMDEVEDTGAWLEPAVVDYYGMPVNMETMPKYEVQREHKYGAGSGMSGNRYGTKRYMVARKKRSLGKALNKRSVPYNSNY